MISTNDKTGNSPLVRRVNKLLESRLENDKVIRTQLQLATFLISSKLQIN